MGGGRGQSWSRGAALNFKCCLKRAYTCAVGVCEPRRTNYLHTILYSAVPGYMEMRSSQATAAHVTSLGIREEDMSIASSPPQRHGPSQLCLLWGRVDWQPPKGARGREESSAGGGGGNSQFMAQCLIHHSVCKVDVLGLSEIYSR